MTVKHGVSNMRLRGHIAGCRRRGNEGVRNPAFIEEHDGI